MRIPDWWQATLLAAAAFRCFRLLGKDVILDPLRARVVGLHGWTPPNVPPAAYRRRLAEFLICGWCLGAWSSVVWWAAWQTWPHAALVVAAPFAISTAVGLAAQLDRDD